MNVDRDQIETRTALLEQAVSRIGDDISFIRSKMEDLEPTLVRIAERISAHATDISRAFEAIRANQKAIEDTNARIQVEKEKTDKWLNIGIGIWITASTLWILFGAGIAWWVSRVNDKLVGHSL